MGGDAVGQGTAALKKFANMGEFASFFASRIEAAKHAQVTGLRDAAELIQETTRAKLGHYQPAAGPFEAWKELAEVTKEEREELGFNPDDPLLRTGELRDSIGISYGENRAAVGVEFREVGDGSRQNPIRDIGEVAIDMEVGYPPRSFLGATAFEQAGEAAKIVGRTVAEAIAGIPYQYKPPHVGTPKSSDDIPF